MDSMTAHKKEDGFKSREVLPDVLRGFAVLLVVLGHAIQVGNGADFRLNSLYFEDPLYHFIYSFHMPLFMLISGFFAHSAVTRGLNGPADAAREIRGRASKLVIPILLWSILDYLRSCAEILAGGHNRLEILALAEHFPVSFLTNLWFLWSVFFNFVIVLIAERLTVKTGRKIRGLLYVVLFLLMFVTPDGLNLGAYKFMFPYFLIGYLAAKTNVKEGPALAAAGVLFALLFLFYRTDSLIYVSGYKLIGRGGPEAVLSQLGVDLYRFAAGLAGSLFFILLFRYLLRGKDENPLVRLISYLGRESMGIYILSGYIQTILFVPVTDRIAASAGGGIALYLLDGINMAAAVGISVLLIGFMSRVKILKKLIGK